MKIMCYLTILAVNNLTERVRHWVKFLIKKLAFTIKIERLVAKTRENKAAVCFLKRF